MGFAYSRIAIKKYILANNKNVNGSSQLFNSQFNKAIRTGVDKGEFIQPHGKFARESLGHLHWESNSMLFFILCEASLVHGYSEMYPDYSLFSFIAREIFHDKNRLCLSADEFTGSSGTVKLANKASAAKSIAATEKKPAATKVCTVFDVGDLSEIDQTLQKDGTAKPAAPKKRAVTKKDKPKATEKKATEKKASGTKKATAPKPKANTASKRKTPVTV